MSQPLLFVDNLSVSYPSPQGPIEALHSLTFSVDEGSCLAIVGESASGKSTAALSILGLLPPSAAVTDGRIVFSSRQKGTIDLIAASQKDMRMIRGAEISAIFQDAMDSLDPVYDIGSQIDEVLLLHHFRRDERRRTVDELLTRLGLGDGRLYSHELSGGMRQRLAISIALAARPALLIADEVTTALDRENRTSVLSLIARSMEEDGLSVLLITHDLDVARTLADHILVIHSGRLVESARSTTILDRPAHPYTQALLDATPSRHHRKERGHLPPSASSGCPFAGTCTYAQADCQSAFPAATDLGGGHFLACHRRPS